MRALQVVAWLEGIAILVVGGLLFARSGEAPVPIEAVGGAAASQPDDTTSPTAADAAAGESFVPAREAPIVTDASADAGAEADHGPIAQDMGIILQGEVRVPAGAEVEQLQVSLKPLPDGKERQANLSRQRHYAFAGLAPGNWRAMVHGRGFVTFSEEFTIEPTPQLQTRNFELQREDLVKVAMVAPDGEPLQDATAKQQPPIEFPWFSLTILATAEAPPDELPAATGDRPAAQTLGSFELGLFQEPPLPKRYVGTLRLQHQRPVHVSAFFGTQRLATTELTGPTDEVVLQVDPQSIANAKGTVRFRLLDAETGVPIAGMPVDLDGAHYRGTTDPQGNCVSPPVVCGRHRVIPFSAEHERVAWDCEVRPGQERDLGDLRLQRTLPAITGTMTDSAGRPTDGRVSWIALDHGSVGEIGRANAFAVDASGSFSANRIGRRRYLLLGTNGARELCWTSVDTRQPPEAIELRLRPTIRIAIQQELGPFEAVEILIVDPEGFPVADARVHAGSRQTLRLPAGTYHAELRRDDGAKQSIPFTVGPDSGSLRIPARAK